MKLTPTIHGQIPPLRGAGNKLAKDAGWLGPRGHTLSPPPETYEVMDGASGEVCH